MDAAGCHAPADLPVRSAKEIIYDVIGIGRTADWCDVSESAIYQWFCRKNPREPIPLKHVGAILEGVARENIEGVDPLVIWPSMPRQAA